MWGGGIVRAKKESDWTPWPIDLVDESLEATEEVRRENIDG